jgi:hypothetical protein
MGASDASGHGRCMAAQKADLMTRLQFGPAIIEPVGFAMDRRMLIGIKQRAEQARSAASSQLPSAPGAAAQSAGPQWWATGGPL